MEVTIKIQDKTFSKTQIEYKFITDLPFLKLKDLIFEKVKSEVHSFNSQLADTAKKIVMFNEFEHALNMKTVNDRLLQIEDIEKQYYIALDAFQKNQYFVLINRKQYLDLEDNINISKDLDILFLKLTPLVGG